jgi:hypothetical protein
MSSGLGEWEKGIPCRLRPGGGGPLGLLSAQHVLLPSAGLLALCRVSPLSQAVGGELWPLFTALVSTLAHKGKSQAQSALQDARPHNRVQLQSVQGPQPWLPTGTRAQPVACRQEGAPSSPWCKVWGLPVPSKATAALREPVPVERPHSLSLLRMRLL